MQKIYAMRKVLLSFLIGCLGFISGHASTIVSQDWVPGPILGGNNGDLNDGRHLSRTGYKDLLTVNECLTVSYDPELSALIVYSPTVQGLVYAVIQNQTFVKPRMIRLAPGDDTVIPINTWMPEVQRLTVFLRNGNPILILDVLFYISDDGILWFCKTVE